MRSSSGDAGHQYRHGRGGALNVCKLLFLFGMVTLSVVTDHVRTARNLAAAVLGAGAAHHLLLCGRHGFEEPSL